MATNQIQQKMSRKRTGSNHFGWFRASRRRQGEHSPFTLAFLCALNKNNGAIDGTKLFNAIRRHNTLTFAGLVMMGRFLVRQTKVAYTETTGFSYSRQCPLI